MNEKDRERMRKEVKQQVDYFIRNLKFDFTRKILEILDSSMLNKRRCDSLKIDYAISKWLQKKHPKIFLDWEKHFRMIMEIEYDTDNQ